MKDYYLFKESLNLNWHSPGSIGFFMYGDNKIKSISRGNYPGIIQQSHPTKAWNKLVKHEILYT